MGRSYWFECSRCGYRATVAGRQDRGADFFVETVSCLECKKLYDVVVRLRVPKGAGLKSDGIIRKPVAPPTPPTFQEALNRLPMSRVSRFRWKAYDARCPVSRFHRVEGWTQPGPCPNCGLQLESNPLPYRIWE